MPVLPAKLAFASPRLVSATNLITGLADALLDSIPVVAITGQVSAPFIGTDAFQEVDILGLSLACTKHSFWCNHWKSYRVSWPKRLTSPALVVWSGLVDIPKDIQLASGDLEPWFTTVENEVTFSHAEVEQARQMLAKRKNRCCTLAVAWAWRRQFRLCVNFSLPQKCLPPVR